MNGNRKFFRVGANDVVLVTEKRYLTRDEKKEGFLGDVFELVDVSASGMRIKGEMKFVEGERVYINLKVDGEYTKFEGEILSFEPVDDSIIDYRINLHYIQRKDEHTLFKYVNRLQGDKLKQKSIESYDRGEKSLSAKMEIPNRRGRVGAVRVLPFIGLIVSSVVFIMTLMLIFLARPRATDPLSVALSVPYSLKWNMEIFKLTYISSGIMFVVSGLSYLVNYSYSRRREDKPLKLLMILTVIALVSIMIQSTFIFTRPYP